jgi:hypothetical protein
MDSDKFGVAKGEHIPAEKVLDYLHAFADDAGISNCILPGTKVETIEKTDEYWVLHCSWPDGDRIVLSISTAKLIIAVGLVNEPAMPRYPTSPTFAPMVIHSKDFPAHFSDIAKAGKHTLVIGGAKSAWDIAYACATQPSSTVTMLIRPSGNGPVWMSPPYVTPLELWLEKLVFTRFFGFMSPCPWAETSGFEGWVRSFLHGTWLGRKIVGAFWGVLGDDVVQLNKFDGHPETKKLRPWRHAFEIGTGLSILNYPTNFFDLVKEGKIKVLIDEVENCGNGKEVTLRGGQKLSVDAVVCATGWKPSEYQGCSPGRKSRDGDPRPLPVPQDARHKQSPSSRPLAPSHANSRGWTTAVSPLSLHGSSLPSPRPLHRLRRRTYDTG